ncbi:MAG: hypothetical protein QME92_12635 [Bacillota bacterium]|nr:hypothetical protein [Bacillota bacterium]
MSSRPRRKSPRTATTPQTAKKFLDEEGGGIVASRAFSRPGAEGSTKKIVIRAWTLMGGVEVKQA